MKRYKHKKLILKTIAIVVVALIIAGILACCIGG